MRELPRLRLNASWTVATLQNARPKLTRTWPIIIRHREVKEMGRMMPWLPSTESSAKSSPWRTIVIPNASLGKSLSDSSRAGESFFLAIDLWYCSAASCNLGGAAIVHGWCKVRPWVAKKKSSRRTDAILLCGARSPVRAPWLLL